MRQLPVLLRLLFKIVIIGAVFAALAGVVAAVRHRSHAATPVVNSYEEWPDVPVNPRADVTV